jgi:L,D-peptidoglycan transpeptidase YkuD (ErfK/YbiS/YcfS/YnhG family)
MPRAVDGAGMEGLPIDRRGLLMLAVPLTALRVGEVAALAPEHLEYRDGRLRWSSGSALAAVGRGGIRADKKEGDGATPSGTYPLVFGLYRRDRIAPPASRLPMRPLAPNDAWVDDPADVRYNRLVSLPYPARTELLWRDDQIYDLLIVIGYNMEPIIAGAGSAIFLHIARPNFSTTAGCIAIAREVLTGLIPLLGPGSTITIEA